MKPGHAVRGRARVVVARGALRIKQLDLSSLPLKEQWKAARLQALAWAPFEQSDLRLVLVAGKALLMAWNCRGLEAQARALGLDPTQWTLVTEPMLRSVPNGQEVRLLQGLDGHEGQLWQNGMLIATRWWPSVPDLPAWLNFLRSAGRHEAIPGAIDRVPPPTAAHWLAKPWAPVREAHYTTGRSGRAERWLVVGAALVAVAATAAQGRQTWEQHRRLQALRSERDAMVAEVAPLLAERSRALVAMNVARQLAERLGSGDPLGVMAHLAAVLPRDGVLLKELMVEGRDVRLVIEAPATVSRAALVSALQSRGQVTNVSESTDGVQRGWVAFSFKFSSAEQPAAPAAPASGARA